MVRTRRARRRLKRKNRELTCPTRTSRAERRKSWLYDVPLASQHALRAKLNSPGQLSVRDGAGPDLSIVDLPVLCATTKLWLLELEQPPFTRAAYDELRTTWPSRGTAVADPAEGEAVGEGNTEAKDGSAEKIDVLAKVVGKLPKIHFDVRWCSSSKLVALTVMGCGDRLTNPVCCVCRSCTSSSGTSPS